MGRWRWDMGSRPLIRLRIGLGELMFWREEKNVNGSPKRLKLAGLATGHGGQSRAERTKYGNSMVLTRNLENQTSSSLSSYVARMNPPPAPWYSGGLSPVRALSIPLEVTFLPWKQPNYLTPKKKKETINIYVVRFVCLILLLIF